MDFSFASLDRYLTSVLPQRSATLAKMEILAERLDFPIIGPQVGRLLYQYARLTGAKRVFELGSGFGYSAFWFSLALGSDVEIHLTDFDEANLEKARSFFKSGKLKSRFYYHSGDALNSFARTSGSFDIILNDIDKESYPGVARVAPKRLRKGGLLISDNLLKSGKVFGGGRDKATLGVRKYTKIVYRSTKLWTTIVPLRDGVAVSLKL